MVFKDNFVNILIVGLCAILVVVGVHLFSKKDKDRKVSAIEASKIIALEKQSLDTAKNQKKEKPKKTKIFGQAVKGPFRNAEVDVFSLNSKGNVISLLANTKTDSNGNYEVSLKRYSGLIQVVVEGEAYNETTKKFDDIILSAVKNIKAGETREVSVTIFSDLASQDIFRSLRDMKKSNASNVIQRADNKISKYFGLASVEVIPSDLSKIGNKLDSYHESTKAAVISAAVTKLAKKNETDIEMMLDFLEQSIEENNGSDRVELYEAAGSFLTENLQIDSIMAESFVVALNQAGISYRQTDNRRKLAKEKKKREVRFTKRAAKIKADKKKARVWAEKMKVDAVKAKELAAQKKVEEVKVKEEVAPKKVEEVNAIDLVRTSKTKVVKARRVGKPKKADEKRAKALAKQKSLNESQTKALANQKRIEEERAEKIAAQEKVEEEKTKEQDKPKKVKSLVQEEKELQRAFGGQMEEIIDKKAIDESHRRPTQWKK